MTAQLRPRKKRKGNRKSPLGSQVAPKGSLRFYYVAGETINDSVAGIPVLDNRPDVTGHDTYKVPPSIDANSSEEDLMSILKELRACFHLISLPPDLLNTHIRYCNISGILSVTNFRYLLSATSGGDVQVPVWECPLEVADPGPVPMSHVPSEHWKRAVAVSRVKEVNVDLDDLFPRPYVNVSVSLNAVFQRFGIQESSEHEDFQWYSTTEISQIRRQVGYLEGLLQLEKFKCGDGCDFFWKHLRSVTVPLFSNGNGITGNADILVGQSARRPILAFEIKRPPAPFDLRQSNSETLGYATNSTYPVLHVTTDLQSDWQLRWLKHSSTSPTSYTLCTLEVGRTVGVNLIRYFYVAALHALFDPKLKSFKDLFDAGFGNHGGGGDGNGGEEGDAGGNFENGDWFGRPAGAKLDFPSGPNTGAGVHQDAVLASESLEPGLDLRQLQLWVEAEVEEEFKYVEKEEWSDEERARQKNGMQTWLFVETIMDNLEAKQQGLTYDEFCDKKERERDEASVRNPIEAMLHSAESMGDGDGLPDLDKELYKQQPRELRVRHFLESQLKHGPVLEPVS